MSRLRLRINPRDRAFVEVQGSTKRKFKPFAHAFGAKSEANAALIVQAVNCHHHMVVAIQRIQQAANRPVNGNGARLRTRLALIANITAAALKRIDA